MSEIIKQCFIAIAFALAISISAIAQSTASSPAKQGPSNPDRPYVVLSGQSMDDLQKKLHTDNRVQELYGGEGVQLRVAVQHDKNTAPAVGEVHDASDDVYYVLDGTATLTLGGKLEEPREVEPGEWRGKHIIGGKDIEISKGDLIVVPRGTPHERNTVGKDFTMILIKVYENGLPAKHKPAVPKP